MNSIFKIALFSFSVVVLTNGAPVGEDKKTSVGVEKEDAVKKANESLAKSLIGRIQQRKKRQGYYNLGNTDFKPTEYNDGVSNQQLANPLSPAHQIGPNIFGDPSDPNQVASGWVGQQFQGDVGQIGAGLIEGSETGQYKSPYTGNSVGLGNLGGLIQNTTDTISNATTENGNGYANGNGNGHGNGHGNGNGNGYSNGNGNGNGGYNPFANVRPNPSGTANQNYLQTNYGVQANLYNPLLHSIYGYQYQQNQPFISEQQNQYGKPQNQIENQQQVINNPNLFGGYGQYNSPLTFEQVYGPYLNTAGYNPTTTTKKPRTTTEPPRYKYSKSFNPYEGMTTRRLPVTPQVLWYSRYVDLTAPIAAVPFSNYNNI